MRTEVRLVLVVLAVGAVALSVGLAVAIFPPRVTFVPVLSPSEVSAQQQRLTSCEAADEAAYPGTTSASAFTYCWNRLGLVDPSSGTRQVQQVTLRRGLVVGFGALLALVLGILAAGWPEPEVSPWIDEDEEDEEGVEGS